MNYFTFFFGKLLISLALDKNQSNKCHLQWERGRRALKANQ